MKKNQARRGEQKSLGGLEVNNPVYLQLLTNR